MLDEEFDISASEIYEYKEIIYKLLKFRPHKINGPNGKFRCPFCADKEEEWYHYTRLLQHAIQVSEDLTVRAKQRANHLAIAAYLAVDVPSVADQSLPDNTTSPRPAQSDADHTALKIDAMEVEKEWNDKTTSPGPGYHSLFDYEGNSEGSVGDHLSKIGALKTTSDNFVNLLDTEVGKLKSMTSHHVNGALEELEKLNLELENKRQQLDSSSKELDKREEALTVREDALTVRESRNLKSHKRKKESRHLQEANKLQRDAEENFSKLVETLKEKEDELLNLNCLYKGLTIKERQMNDEFHDARKVLIEGLKDMSSHSCVTIGVKRMGEIDEKVFKNTCEKRYSPTEAENKAAELCSLWQEKLKNPEWHPFRIIEDGRGNTQKVLKEDDKQLRGLKDKWGEEVYNAVVAALKEVHEYNPSGCYPVSELWNFKENRRATLKEVIKYVFTHSTTLKRKKH